MRLSSSSFAERLSVTVKAAPSQGDRFEYIGCCCDFQWEFIEWLRAESTDTSLDHMKLCCDSIDVWAHEAGFAEDTVKLSEDPLVCFKTTIIDGVHYYFIEWSAIEWVWREKRPLESINSEDGWIIKWSRPYNRLRIQFPGKMRMTLSGTSSAIAKDISRTFPTYVGIAKTKMPRFAAAMQLWLDCYGE